MRRGHLSDVEALAAVLGEAASAGADAHLADCAHCRARVAEAREGHRLASGTRLVEPDDAFWRTLRRGIAERVAAAAAAARPARTRTVLAWSLAAATTLLLSVAVWSVRHSGIQPRAAVQAAWVPLASADEDPGFALISEVVPALDDDAPTWRECRGCLEGLSDDETRMVIDELRGELGRKS